ncbi:protein TALPID3-like isoform X2 [Brachyhypopomus gauderio]|uniref:protein TALPID3-like isoform X2 n=1 Tax=Brachyhypopomus gauderio TaxID=698409 RepID=UPI0040439140
MNVCVSTRNNVNLNDSASSSDAADVLIRSTKVLVEQMNDRRSAAPGRSDVNIYVQRLSDSPHGSCLSETSKQGFVEQKVPPVFPANIPSALFGGSEEDDTASKQALGVARNNNVLRTGKDKKKPSVIQTRDSEQKGQDVLISRYAADGRGAIVAAMKQRSNSGPVRREVKVQLLDAGPSSREPLQSPEVQQPSPAFSAGDGVAATAVAAITAATMAATAPIIQAQTAMVARVDRVASELRQLQEAAGGGTDRGPVRAAQLEEDLTTLTLQRLRHLEKVQDQQLQLQNRLLGSALDAVAARGGPPWPTVRGAGEGVTVPESANGPGLRTLPAGDSPAAAAVQSHSKRTQTGWVKSPLETPAPRKVIPKPTHWIPTSQNTQQSNQTHKGIQESYGDGRPLDWIPISQRSHTRNPAHTAGARGVAMATVDDTEPKQFSLSPLRRRWMIRDL